MLVLGLPLAVARGRARRLRAGAPRARAHRADDRAGALDHRRAAGDRLPVTNPDDEMGRLASVFNETLGAARGVVRADAAVHRRRLARAPHAAHRDPQRRRGGPARPARRARLSRHHRQHARGGRSARRASSIGCSRCRAPRPARRSCRSKTCDLTALADDVAPHLGVLAEEKRQTIVVERRARARRAGRSRWCCGRRSSTWWTTPSSSRPRGGDVRIRISRDARRPRSST